MTYFHSCFHKIESYTTILRSGQDRYITGLMEPHKLQDQKEHEAQRNEHYENYELSGSSAL